MEVDQDPIALPQPPNASAPDRLWMSLRVETRLKPPVVQRVFSLFLNVCDVD